MDIPEPIFVSKHKFNKINEKVKKYSTHVLKKAEIKNEYTIITCMCDVKHTYDIEYLKFKRIAKKGKNPCRECKQLRKYEKKYGEIKKRTKIKEYTEKRFRLGCYKTPEESLVVAKQLAEYRFGKCLSTGYKSVKHKLQWMCKFGHKWSATYNSICYMGSWCPTCSRSRGEEICRATFEEAYGKINDDGKLELTSFDSTRDVIIYSDARPLELDGYCEKLQIAFEYQGIQHYKPVVVMGGDDCFKSQIENDNAKKIYCEKLNIKLFVIPFVRDHGDIRQHVRNILIDAGETILPLELLPSNREFHESNLFKCPRAGRYLKTMKDICAKHSIEVLTDVCVSCSIEYKFKCSKGHKFRSTLSRLKGNDQRERLLCVKCSPTREVSIKKIKKVVEKGIGQIFIGMTTTSESERCHSGESKRRVIMKCANGHTHDINLANISIKKWLTYLNAQKRGIDSVDRPLEKIKCHICAHAVLGAGKRSTEYDITASSVGVTFLGTKNDDGSYDGIYERNNQEYWWECQKCSCKMQTTLTKMRMKIKSDTMKCGRCVMRIAVKKFGIIIVDDVTEQDNFDGNRSNKSIEWTCKYHPDHTQRALGPTGFARHMTKNTRPCKMCNFVHKQDVPKIKPETKPEKIIPKTQKKEKEKEKEKSEDPYSPIAYFPDDTPEVIQTKTNFIGLDDLEFLGIYYAMTSTGKRERRIRARCLKHNIEFEKRPTDFFPRSDDKKPKRCPKCGKEGASKSMAKTKSGYDLLIDGDMLCPGSDIICVGGCKNRNSYQATWRCSRGHLFKHTYVAMMRPARQRIPCLGCAIEDICEKCKLTTNMDDFEWLAINAERTKLSWSCAKCKRDIHHGSLNGVMKKPFGCSSCM
jgi:hypothetical protein